MPVCPECNNEYAAELSACPACGAEPAVLQCGRCGEEFSGADSCPACGKVREAVPCELHGETLAEARCVICGRALCRECENGGGPASLCLDHADATIIQGWAQIYTTASEFEAQLLRDNLLAEGIDARIFSQKDNIFSVDLGELSIVRLLVPAWDYERATVLIRGHMDQEGEVAFACPSCGEAYEPGATTCVSCGALLAQSVSD